MFVIYDIFNHFCRPSFDRSIKENPKISNPIDKSGKVVLNTSRYFLKSSVYVGNSAVASTCRDQIVYNNIFMSYYWLLGAL